MKILSSSSLPAIARGIDVRFGGPLEEIQSVVFDLWAEGITVGAELSFGLVDLVRGKGMIFRYRPDEEMLYEQLNGFALPLYPAPLLTQSCFGLHLVLEWERSGDGKWKHFLRVGEDRVNLPDIDLDGVQEVFGVRDLRSEKGETGGKIEEARLTFFKAT